MLVTMDSELSRKIQQTKSRLISQCFEGNREASYEASDWLEELLKRKANCNDFTPQQDPAIAACLGKHFDLAAHFIDEGVTIITQNTVSVAETELPHLMRVWVKPNQDGKLEASWSNKHLCVLYSNWLQFPIYQSTLVDINLSHNDLVTIPELLLWGLSELQILNLSHNKIQSLPGPANEERLQKSSMSELKLFHNDLSGVPVEVFQLPNLKKLELQHNQITSLDPSDSISRLGRHGPDERWLCSKLKDLDLRDNQLESLPDTAIQGATNLNKLVISQNRLTKLPSSWSCPLETLHAKDNYIEALKDLHQHWELTLQTLELGGNLLDNIPDTVCRLTALDSLNLEKNRIKTLPPRNKCKIFKLHTLDLSENQLVYSDESAVSVSSRDNRPSRKRPASMSSIFHDTPTMTSSPPSSPEPKANQDGVFDFLNALSSSLKHLHLAKNYLEAVPPCVCRLHRLLTLDLSGNEKLETLPNELAMVRNLLQLKEPENLKEPQEVAELIKQKMPRKTDRILFHLKDRLYQSEPYRGMKLVVVGPMRGGKTTLIGSLIGDSHWPDEDKHVNTCEWSLTDPNHKSSIYRRKGGDDSYKVTFTIWDLKGGDVYDTIQPCLYTDKCLYLVVWDGSDGANTVDNLKYWVADIKQKAPQSEVILVGTHSDNFRVKTADKEEEIRKRLTETFKLYLVSSASSKRTPSDGIHALKLAIYQCAVNAKMNTSSKIQQNIVGRKVPKSFIQLKASLEAMRKRMNKNILTREDIQILLHKDKIKDTDSETYLQEALAFLSTSGTILPVKIRSGRQLNILDPVWLCRLLYCVTQVSNFQLREGKCALSTLIKLSSANGLKNHQDDFIQLVEGLEVALPVDKERKWFWIPAKLPKDKPAATFPNDNLPCLRRYYQLPYTPPGFWVRLVSRLVVSLKQTGQQTRADRAQSSVGPNDESDSLLLESHRNLSRDLLEGVGLNLSLTSMFYWQEGILAMHDTGRILVEKHTFDNGKSGISIQIFCKFAEFKEMAFVVDHIENLIKDWYPGLLSNFQQPALENPDFVVRRLIPCPECTDSRQSSQSRGEHKHLFNVEDLVIAATYEARHETSCPGNKHKHLKLKSLVPGVFLSDLQVDVFVKEQLPNVNFTEENQLGKGGFGEVFKATHNDENVAVKTLAPTRLVTHEGASLDRYDTFDLVESFTRFRSEVAVMSRLKHAHIVEMKWACIQKLAFAMEFAPEGDLSSVLSKKFTDFKLRHARSRYIHDTVLDRSLTYKMVVQMASAVSYLHSKDFIYCDLKTDNALVFSLDANDPINVKLTDYGISRQLIGPGGFGDAGPPGFCAPEILKHDIFDKKADWFSFGMVLYHLLTGTWPYDDLERSERMAATVRGDRPDFNFCGYKLISTLPSLKSLMEDCWKDQPHDRPRGEAVIRALGDASLLCFRQVIPLQEAAVVGMFGTEGNVNHKLHIWSSRNRTSVEYNQYELSGIATWVEQEALLTWELPDTSNIKSLKVEGNLHIIATVFHGIHIYENIHDSKVGVDDDKPFKLQAKLATIGPVESLCYQSLEHKSKGKLFPHKGRLFIGHQHNKIHVFAQDHTGEWEPIIYQKILLDSKQDASCCNMQLVADDTELWFTCGNTLIAAEVGDIQGHDAIEIQQNIEVVRDRTATIRGMVCQAGFAWCYVIGRSVHQMVQFDISKMKIVGRLDLRGDEKIGDKLALEVVNDNETTMKGSNEISGPGSEDEDEVQSYVLCFQVVDAVLYMGTSRGTIVTVNVSESNFGEVLGILSLGDSTGPLRNLVEEKLEGPVKHLVLIGEDKLIACQEVRHPESRRTSSTGRSHMGRQESVGSTYRLVIWDRWNLERFHWFDKVVQCLKT